MKTLYKTRWYLNTIDGGRDTTNLDLVVSDVRFALQDGFSHVEIKTEEVPEDHPDIP
jgi:hypothetical protein